MSPNRETSIRDRIDHSTARTCVGNAARWADYFYILVAARNQEGSSAFRDAISFVFSVYSNPSTVGGSGVIAAIQQLEDRWAQDSSLDDAAVFSVRVCRFAAEAALAFLKGDDFAVRSATMSAAKCALRAADEGLTPSACLEVQSMIVGNDGADKNLTYAEVEIPVPIAGALRNQWA